MTHTDLPMLVTTKRVRYEAPPVYEPIHSRHILQAVAEVFDITVDDMVNRKPKSKTYCLPRWVYYVVSYRYTHKTMVTIASAIGRPHNLVWHAINLGAERFEDFDLCCGYVVDNLKTKFPNLKQVRK